MATPEKIMQYAWGYAPPLIIEAALRNGVFDALENGPQTVAQAAGVTGASERGLTSIMNALIGLQLLTRDVSGAYALTPDSAEFLVSSRAGFLGGFVKHTSRQLIPKWLDLADIVRTGSPSRRVNSEEDGSAFFEEFVSDIFPMSYGSACAAANALGVASATQPVRVLDLAAGSGVWSIALAQHSPMVTVTAVDWPNILEITRKTAARFGLADRFQFVAGNLDSVDFGRGHHIAVLGHILHSEGVERSRGLLRKTSEALVSGGTIVIGEFLVDADRRGPLQGLIFDVNMLVNTEAGRTYSFEEIRGWLQESGFGNAGVVPSPGPSPLIFANKQV